MSNLSATERIEKIKAEAETAILKLTNEALAELKDKRAAAAAELGRIDAEIAQLTGKPAGKRTRKGGGPKSEGTKPDLQELKAMLSKADGKTLNIRKEGLDLANLKTLAASNPGLLKLGGKSPWFTVTLTK